MSTKKQKQDQQTATASLDFLANWQAPEEQISEIPLPHVQWHNGNGPAFKKVSPLLAQGGWELPLEVWGAVLGDQYEALEIPHGVGNDVIDPGYILPLIHIAVINTRFTWERMRGGKVEYVRSYEDGCRGRLNVYCLVQELGDEPVMLTLRGLVTKHFNAAKRQHLTSIVKMANKLGQARYPQYLFWMPLQSGDPVEAGEGDLVSKITPPVAAWNLEAFNQRDVEAIAQELQTLYIGDEYRDLIAERLFQEGVEWAGQYDQLEVDNTSPEKNPYQAQLDEDGRLIIPDLAEADIPSWLRWGESALELEQGEGSSLFASVLRKKRPGQNAQKQWNTWANYVESEYNKANGILSEEAQLEQMLQNGG